MTSVAVAVGDVGEHQRALVGGHPRGEVPHRCEHASRSAGTATGDHDDASRTVSSTDSRCSTPNIAYLPARTPRCRGCPSRRRAFPGPRSSPTPTRSPRSRSHGRSPRSAGLRQHAARCRSTRARPALATLGVEPVPRLERRHRVERQVGDLQRLRGPDLRRDAPPTPGRGPEPACSSGLEHPLRGVERARPRGRGGDRAGAEAGAGAEVEHAAGGGPGRRASSPRSPPARAGAPRRRWSLRPRTTYAGPRTVSGSENAVVACSEVSSIPAT